jgi:leucyl aminopeptidase
MRFVVKDEALGAAKADVLVVGIFAGKKGMDAGAKAIDRKLNGALAEATAFEDFSAKIGQWAWASANGLGAKRVLAVGLGETSDFDTQAAMRAAACAARRCMSAKLKSMAMAVPRAKRMSAHDAACAVAEGVGRACYDPALHHTTDNSKRPKFVTRVQLCAKSAAEVKDLRAGASRGQALAAGVNFTRDLINEPSNELTPALMAKRAKSIAKSSPLVTCKVWGEKEILRHKMGGLYGVGQGSEEPSQFIQLEYKPKGSQRGVKTIALVGKGITFDTGGISIKPSANMELMKFDMGGAAAVLGAFHLLAALEPKARVLGYVAAAENMPSGNAIKPGDVLRMMNGMTVEVNNTDAEGRLVLADAIHHAKQQKPEFIVDAATLTGACMIALGDVACGLMTEDDKLAELILDAGKASGDLAWRLPLMEIHREQMKGHVADLINTGPRDGGALNAAGFLSYFAKDTRWAHLDIAGTVWAGQAKDDNPKGGTGYGARLFYSIVEGAIA